MRSCSNRRPPCLTGSAPPLPGSLSATPPPRLPWQQPVGATVPNTARSCCARHICPRQLRCTTRSPTLCRSRPISRPAVSSYSGHVTVTTRVDVFFPGRFLLRVRSSPSSQSLHGSVPSILQRPRILPAALRRPTILFPQRPSRAAPAPARVLLARLPATPAQRPDGPSQLPRPPGAASVRPSGCGSRRLRPALRQQESVAASGEPPS